VRSASALSGSRLLRRDAEENRRRILTAAEEAFAEQGLEVPVDEIARRAQVGMGTLYRRFPSKAALVEAIFEEYLERVAGIAEDALAADDPWAGLGRFLEQTVGLQAENRGFAAIVMVKTRDEKLLGKARSRVTPLIVRLVERAQAAGVLRPDVVYEDVSVLLWTTARVVEATRDIAPEFWRRYLALTLDGLRPEVATPLPHPPLTERQHRRAMERLSEQLAGRRG
jgi:AcrR family transcriptional regulator